jgi:hypothetical protein
MKDDWLLDGRKIPDEVMNYFRKRAVQAIREKGQSPEVVAKVFGFDRSCILYREHSLFVGFLSGHGSW